MIYNLRQPNGKNLFRFLTNIFLNNLKFFLKQITRFYILRLLKIRFWHSIYHFFITPKQSIIMPSVQKRETLSRAYLLQWKLSKKPKAWHKKNTIFGSCSS